MLHVLLPDGDLDGSGFAPLTDGFEYLFGDDPSDEDDWYAWVGSSGDEDLNMPGVVAGATVGDWVGIRNVGEGQVAIHQIIALTFDHWDGDTASGTIDPTANGVAMVCWWNPLDPENSWGCEEDNVDSGTWQVNGLGASVTYDPLAYFQADDGVHGPELWKTDGTAAGTVMVADLRPNTGKGLPADFGISKGKLYFQAHSGLKGNNMFVLQLDATTKSIGHAYTGTAHAPTMKTDDPVLGALFTMSGDHCEAGSQLAFVLLGSPLRGTVLQGGLSLYVSAPNVLAAAIINGSWNLPLVIPAIPALKGITLASQALITPSTAPLGLSSTEAVHFTIGN